MILGSVFERFINESPLSVMSRATLEHALSASALDALFEDTAERGYTRELLFSATQTGAAACGSCADAPTKPRRMHATAPHHTNTRFIEHLQTTAKFEFAKVAPLGVSALRKLLSYRRGSQRPSWALCFCAFTRV